MSNLKKARMTAGMTIEEAVLKASPWAADDTLVMKLMCETLKKNEECKFSITSGCIDEWEEWITSIQFDDYYEEAGIDRYAKAYGVSREYLLEDKAIVDSVRSGNIPLKELYKAFEDPSLSGFISVDMKEVYLQALACQLGHISIIDYLNKQKVQKLDDIPGYIRFTLYVDICNDGCRYSASVLKDHVDKDGTLTSISNAERDMYKEAVMAALKPFIQLVEDGISVDAEKSIVFDGETLVTTHHSIRDYHTYSSGSMKDVWLSKAIN